MDTQSELTEEHKMLEQAYTLISNLFDMGYAYPSSIEILECLSHDIEILNDTLNDELREGMEQ